MARAIWKGLVNFGLVNIPIELYPASRDHGLRFRLLHRTDLSPIALKRVCQDDGQTLEWSEIVKGYEIEPGRFVVVGEEDFKAAAPERTRSINLFGFVPVAAIDVRFWETPYAAAPASGAEHSYGLLARALSQTGRAGIAKFVLRQRQHLAALLSLNGALLLSTLRFPEQLLALPQHPPQELPARELDLAGRLVESMASEWAPEEYQDDYVAALRGVIEAKAAGARPARTGARRAPRTTTVTDLMARLQQSLAMAKATPGSRSKAAPVKAMARPTRRSPKKPRAA